jgi:ParB-like chromosome segregation protein Spo0J
MSEKKKTEEARRETQARTELITVRLDQIGERREQFCHRDKAVFDPSRLKLFAEQLIREGLQVPIEVVDEPPGAPNPFLLVKGHRRVAALNLCVRMKAPGFTPDMEVPAFRVLDATLKDLLTRSVSDNEARLNLSVHEKIRACKTLYDADVSMSRGASAMGISTSSFERSLVIASTEWMFRFVADGAIDPTPAYQLLTVAKKAERLRELEEDLTCWVEQIKKQIDEKGRKKAEAGKELTDAEKQVKRYMKAHLVQAWKRALKAKQRFGDIKDAKWRYGAELDAEAKKLTIPGVNLNLATTTFAQLAEVAAKLDGLASGIRPFLLMKQREEQLLTNNDAASSTEAYLQKIGLGEAVSLLGGLPPPADEDDDAGEEGPRLERELSGDIEVPGEKEADHE